MFSRTKKNTTRQGGVLFGYEEEPKRPPGPEGSEGNAAGGGRSDLSEWQRSIFSRWLCPPQKI